MESEKVRVIEKEEELCCKDKEIQEVISELINRKYPGLSLETERGQRHHKAVFVANLLFKDTSREEININFITDRIDYMQDSKAPAEDGLLQLIQAGDGRQRPGPQGVCAVFR